MTITTDSPQQSPVTYAQKFSQYCLTTSILWQHQPCSTWLPNVQLREKRPSCISESDEKTMNMDGPVVVTVPGSTVQTLVSCDEMLLEPSYNITLSKRQPEFRSSDSSEKVTDIVCNNRATFKICCIFVYWVVHQHNIRNLISIWPVLVKTPPVSVSLLLFICVCNYAYAESCHAAYWRCKQSWRVKVPKSFV